MTTTVAPAPAPDPDDLDRLLGTSPLIIAGPNAKQTRPGLLINIYKGMMLAAFSTPAEREAARARFKEQHGDQTDRADRN